MDQMAEKTENLYLRMAALFHDIGKPLTKAFDSQRGWTFYKHEEIGAQILKELGRRLKFSNQMIKFISGYTRYHQWAIQLIKEVDRLTDSAIRRFLVEVGELADGLILLAECDLTTSFPEKRKSALGNVEKFKQRIRILEEKEEWRRFKLAISGQDIMAELGIPQGKIVGEIKKQIQDLVISGELENDRKVLLQYLKEHKNKEMGRGHA
jgi:putative nucleotidyltransferase with HDIG domain